MVGTPTSWPPSLSPCSLKSGGHTFDIVVEPSTAFTHFLPAYSLRSGHRGCWLLVFSSDCQVDFSSVTGGHGGEAISIFHALSPTPFSQICGRWLLVFSAIGESIFLR